MASVPTNTVGPPSRPSQEPGRARSEYRAGRAPGRPQNTRGRSRASAGTPGPTQGQDATTRSLPPLTHAYVQWLGDLGQQIEANTGASWQMFITFTFKGNPHPEAAMKQLRRYRLELDLKLYRRRGVNKGKGLAWAIATERQDRGTIHYHCLIGGDHRLDEMNKHDLARKWWDQGLVKGEQLHTGWARVEGVRHQEDVTAYIAKYVTKQGLGIDILGGKRVLQRGQVTLPGRVPAA